MTRKITRRAALGTVMAGLAAAPFVIRSLRRGEGVSVPVDNEGTVSYYFEGPLTPPVSDETKFAHLFSAVISLSPLLPINRKFDRVVYETDTKQELLLTVSDRIVGKAKGEVPEQRVIREIEFERPPECHEDSIVSKVTCTSPGVTLSSEMRKMLAIHCSQDTNGKVNVLSPQNLPMAELTPKYLAKPVSVGSRWNYFLAGDKDLNREGRVEVAVEVLDTFVKDDERFVRFRTDCSYRDKVPAISKGALDFAKQTNEVVRMRTVCVSDFSLDRAVAVRESTISAMLNEHSEDKGNGKLILSHAVTVLSLVS